MHSILKIIGGLLAIVMAWFAAWYFMMAGDVARVKASMQFHNEQLRTTRPTMNLKYDSVHATGFPFRFEVAVARPTLSMIDGTESFSVSFATLTLTPTDSGQGRYRVNLPNAVEALYAEDGKPPEHYFVTADVVPQLALSAAESKNACGPMMGKACEDVAVDAPLISYALGVPKSITLYMTLGSESRDARFQLAPMDFNVPIFQPIPNDMSFPLEIFVRMLREALVFKSPGNEVPAAP